MIFIQIAPEHVLHPVGGVEDAGAQALRSFFQRVEEHALAVFMIAVALRQKRLVVEHFFVERPGIFRQAQRGIGAKKFCQINGIGNGMRNRQVGMAGIDVHRGYVHFDLGRNFFQIKAADAMSRESHAGLELYRNPFRVLADFDGESFGVNFNPRLAAAYIRTKFELRAQIAARAQRILRTGNIGMKPCAIAFDGNADPAFAKLVAARTRSAETECALASFQVRDAHAGEQHAGKFLRRKSHRNPNDRAEDARLAQPMPEGSSAPQTLDLGFAQRQRVLANAQMALGFADLRRGKKRKIVLQIAGQEIINIVFAGVDSGLKRGPRDRRNRGKCGSQRTKSSAVAKLGEVRQSSFVHEAIGEFGVHAVEPHNHHAFHLGLGVSFAAPEQSQELADGPGHQRVEGIKEGDEDGPERRQDGKSRAGAGISFAAQRETAEPAR